MRNECVIPGALIPYLLYCKAIGNHEMTLFVINTIIYRNDGFKGGEPLPPNGHEAEALLVLALLDEHPSGGGNE